MGHENATKDRIRNEAIKLIHEKGFGSVTLTEICKASGINKHTFYYYFKSKDELLKKFYRFPCHMNKTDMMEIFSCDSHVEQLWLLRKNIMNHIACQGVSILKQLLVKNINDNVGTFEMSEEREHLRKAQLSIIDKGKASGEILSRKETEVLLILLNQSSNAIMFAWCIKNGSFDLWKHIRFMFEKILDVSPEHCTVQDDFIKEYWYF
ncbi:MAG: TetR/AcrR family transcriptional regulator [Bacillota bacterium]|nr:TetR/AcrR family transcriptional regulator [Bacillota bacterium]